MTQQQTPEGAHECTTTIQVFRVFLQLGLTSFGGPVAHIGYFHNAFVVHRRWLSEQAYADLVALCQFLPGPASSQVGMGIGLTRAGVPGALAAWLGFTLPSALLLMGFGYGLLNAADVVPPGVLQGVLVAVVAVVAQAVWGMGRSLCPDLTRRLLAVVCAGLVLLLQSPLAQLIVIAGSGMAGSLLIQRVQTQVVEGLRVPVSSQLAWLSMALFVSLLVLLPLAALLWPYQGLALIDSFFRAGSLVFGGGHVVLPLLESEVVAQGWVDSETFLAGYGAAQLVPGPLFTFAAYLGVVLDLPPNGLAGGVIALLAIFLPSFLLLLAILPFWSRLQQVALVRQIMAGVNAGVVGLLLAALYDPVWKHGVESLLHAGMAIVAALLLIRWSVPVWAVVAAMAVVGGLVF
ncbi:MAG: chromate efflux transporter [bacterium]